MTGLIAGMHAFGSRTGWFGSAVERIPRGQAEILLAGTDSICISIPDGKVCDGVCRCNQHPPRLNCSPF